MKRMIGAILMTGLIAAGCRPTGAPLVTAPTAGATTTTTGAQLPAAEPSKTTQPPGENAGALVLEEVPSREVDVDLAELDDLLKGLDEVLASLQDTMEEGEDQ
jgi:hypothetical protein